MLKSQCEPRECGADDESECTAKVELTKAKSYELSGDLSDPADVFGLSGTWKTDETLLSSCEEKVKCKPNTTRPAGYAYLVYNRLCLPSLQLCAEKSAVDVGRATWVQRGL